MSNAFLVEILIVDWLNFIGSTVASDNIVNLSDRDVSFNSYAYADVPYTTLNFNLKRQSRILILVSIRFNILGLISTDTGSAVYQLNIDGTNDGFPLTYSGVEGHTNGISGNAQTGDGVLSYQKIVTLNPGAHTIKLQNYYGTGTGTGYLRTIATSMTYIILGK